MRIITCSRFGSLNVRDTADALIARAFIPTAVGFQQRFPMETPAGKNLEFINTGLRSRRGSELATDNSALLTDTNEAVIDAFCWRNPVTNAQIETLLTTHSILTNQSGTWVRINNSGGTAYSHAATATKGRIDTVDGHIVYSFDGANKMQTYRSGADLDAGLTNAAAWEHSYDGSTDTITGTWPDATYITAVIHGRLCFCLGDNEVLVTPGANTVSSGVWDLAGGTGKTLHVKGAIRMMAILNPGSLDQRDSILYIGSAMGLSYMTGFASFDREEEGVDDEAALNHRAYFRTGNWLVYMTRNKNIKAVRGGQVIDLAARLRNVDEDGPLDLMDVDTSEDTAFGYYDPDNKMGGFFYSTESTRYNDSLITLDFKLGEPIAGEAQDSFELQRVRLMYSQIQNPDTNDWFCAVYKRDTGLIGVTRTGKLYTMNTGLNDMDSFPIEATCPWPDFTAGDADSPRQKQWFRFEQTFETTGFWASNARFYLNRDTASVDEYTITQAPTDAFIIGTSVIGDPLSGGGMVRNSHRINARSETIRPEVENLDQDESMVLVSQSLTYEPLAIVR